MTIARHQDKPISERKPHATPAPTPAVPRVYPPLLSDGVEALRDSHC